MRVALLLLVACATRHTIPADDRKALEDFRVVDRAQVFAVATTLRQYDEHLTDDWEAERRVSAAVTTWSQMRVRIAGEKLANRELDELVHRYLEQRADAWASLSRSFNWGEQDPATWRDRYKTDDATAAETLAAIDALLAKLDLPAPVLTPDAGIVFEAPPPAKPGAAYLLAGSTAMVLDEAGFHVVAKDVGTIHVAENGVMWTCSTWSVVKWDGKTANEIKPKIYNQACGIGVDGTLWVSDAASTLESGSKDRIASFDGKSWKVITAPVGAGWRGIEQIIGTRDGTLYARAERRLLVLDHGAWRDVARDRFTPSHSIEHLFLGGDGNAWIIHQTTVNKDNPDILSPIGPEGVGKPVYVDDHFQTSNLWANVDANGKPTIFDARRNVVVRDGKTLRLPMPNTHAYWYASPGGFAYDAAGRIWVDLVDGLSVIDPDGTRHVFPIGSVDGLDGPLHQIFVLGAGPTLPRTDVATVRPIHGTLSHVPNTDIIACVDARGDPPCGKGVQTWTARTDENGRFTLDNVPRYRLDLQAHTGLRGHKRWRSLTGKCCDGDATELEFELAPDPQY